MKKLIYLDNAATTFPKSEAVYKEMDRINRTLAFNSGRGSYKAAKEAEKIIQNTKDGILKLVNADTSSTVAFTPSITIALNQILQGLEYSRSSVIYVSPYEHNAVARTINLIQKKYELKVIELPIDNESLEIDINKMKYLFAKDKPTYVCVNAVSNVTGYILPIKEIFTEAHKHGAVTIADTAQCLGTIPFNMQDTQTDIAAFAGHKSLYGPFGVGGIIIKDKIKLNEVIVGGTGSDSLNLDMAETYPEKLESSSKNITAIGGLHKALDEIEIEGIYKKERKLTEYLVSELKKLDNVILYVPKDSNKHIGIVSFNIEGYKAADVGMILDEDYNIAVRTGYHCAPYIHKYLDDEKHLGTIRVGIGKFNTKEDINALIKAVKEIVLD